MTRSADHTVGIGVSFSFGGSSWGAKAVTDVIQGAMKVAPDRNARGEDWLTDTVPEPVHRPSPGPVDSQIVETSSLLEGGVVTNQWHGRYRALLIGSDLLAIYTTLLLSYFLCSAALRNSYPVPKLLALEVGIGLIWSASLYVVDAYQVRRVVSGPEEWRRIVRAGALAAGLSVGVCYYFGQDFARGFLIAVFPIGIVLLTAGRLTVRRVVHLRRTTRGWQYRTLAVGSAETVRHLIQTSSNAAKPAGLVFVGACVDDEPLGSEILPGVPVVGQIHQAADQAAALGADVVALSGGGMRPNLTKELSWKLEGTGRRLVMAHCLGGVAGPRLHVSPLEGMPLVWIDQPQFNGPRRRLKRMFDVTAAILGLLVLSPFLALVALAVRLTSDGPVLFTQSRLGLNGDEFMVLKFRTMCSGAEQQRALLMERNENDGVLFKLRSDPRVTPVGNWLRKLSIDELPQLWNVVRGHMSLVGPRPLATIDSTYTGHARRRLLVRPGITGLWQVSGRSNLSWDEAVRLDLYYVENWSLALDVTLIAKTISAVFLRRGAY